MKSEATRAYCKKIEKINFFNFKKFIFKNNKLFLRKLRNGTVFIVKKAASKKKIDIIKNKLHKFGKTKQSKWVDIKNFPKNFHQIDNELSFYKTKKKSHVYHVFEWNRDTYDIFKYFKDIIEVFHKINGNENYKLKLDKKLNKILHRYQVHHYPSGGGHMDYHNDPDKITKTIALLYMSSYGKDYKSGGLKLLNKENKLSNIDIIVEKGDMVFAYPGIYHGCDKIDENCKLSWSSKKGRWMFMLNTLSNRK